jgi:hypothetical protein
MVKLQKIAVWGALLAGALGVITGLRDTFAPGFFNISPQVKSKTDIILQFVSGLSWFAIAYLFSLSPRNDRDKKK